MDLVTTADSSDFHRVQCWNSADLAPVQACVHELFVAQALRSPEDDAVSAWDGDFTYAQLHHLSDAVAHRLGAKGIEHGAFVPICFEKSKWAVVAMLAVLKSGAAFVMLDPAQPIERLRHIIRSVDAATLLASPEQADRLNGVIEDSLLLTDDLLQRIPISGASLSLPTVSSDDVAYVLFTSGSTGVPKGCIVSHIAYCSSARAHSEAMGLKRSRRVFQFASYSFDAMCVEILTSLTVGACVCVPSEAERMDDIAWAIRKYNVDWTFLTPTVLKLLHPHDVPCLKTLVVGGEAAPQSLIDVWVDAVELLNGFGPTETVVFATCNRFRRGTAATNLGRGIGAHCWVVNFAEERHCRVGEVGELLIETPAMAQGYLNNERQTAAVFISCPSWLAIPGREGERRMYKTGDLACYQDDGSLHYRGRADNQVKIRGQRMELGEVENQLHSNEAIRSAVVLARELPDGSKSLVGIVTTRATMSPKEQVDVEPMHPLPRTEDRLLEVTGIQQRLSDCLPEFMVPLSWIILPLLPVSVSGKVDRRQLALWMASLDADHFLPWIREQQSNHDRLGEVSMRSELTPEERIIQTVWSEILNLPLERVCLHHSFISLGGDSITAMQVVSKCRAQDLTVRVFHILRLASLELVAAASSLRTTSTAVSVLPSDDEEKYSQSFELSPIQRFFFATVTSGRDHFNQSLLLESARSISADEINSALQSILARHPLLRARFRCDATGEWSQHIRQLQSTLDIEQGPLTVAALFETGDGQQLFFWTWHHVVVDLVSWRTILAELEEHLLHGSIASPRPLSFPCWLEALQSHVHGKSALDVSGTLPHQVHMPVEDFWHMSGIPNLTEDIITETFVLDPDTTTALLSPACNGPLRTTVVDLLVASLIYAFSAVFPDRMAPTIFNEGHGREPWHESIDLSTTVGGSPHSVPSGQRAGSRAHRYHRYDQRSTTACSRERVPILYHAVPPSRWP
ncbi:hypothetical protein MRB53_041982 [Persea americana]|nr:hypothetical protein MRB53_041982 [Persea americana]